MNHLTKPKSAVSWRIILSVLGASALTVAPLQGLPAAHADKARSFDGTVTRLTSDRQFDIKSNGKTYNVYLDSDAPRGLSVEDEVRVYGFRFGDNDIRNASVQITQGRRSSKDEFEGQMVNWRDDSSFDIRVNGKIYNVYMNHRAPRRLSNGDTIRVRGTRYGDNDIRDAEVTSINGDNIGWGGGNWGGGGRHDDGAAVDVQGKMVNWRDSRTFDIKVDGKTYNVYLDRDAPRRLSVGDDVRVRGVRYGDNDIRNASVYVEGDDHGRPSRDNFDGTVQNLRNSREFDLRSNGKTYNVYLDNDAPYGLRNGDTITVQGIRTGDNDIRNATVLRPYR
jgi:membrane protein implicated in regulation of membrane protease activity